VELNVILASNVVHDERLGGSKVPLRLDAYRAAIDLAARARTVRS
jgi:hypothetical protein